MITEILISGFKGLIPEEKSGPKIKASEISNRPKDLQYSIELLCQYLLLTEFEVRTVSYGPSFFPSDLWPKRGARGP